MKKPGRPKKPNRSKLKKELDRVFSIWIRKRDQNKCFTCPGTATQNGHYESRTHMNTRWDEQNCHAQCTMCNIFKHGNMPEYALALQRKYGDGILKELHEKKQRIRQFSMQELTDLIAKYSEDKGT